MRHIRDPYFFHLHGEAQRPLRVGRRAVVRQWEQALLFRHGVLVETLGPGAHRRWRKGFTFTRVDTRPSVLTVPTQDPDG